MYKHRVVQGLADILNEFGGGGSDPMMRAIWFGIRGQIPIILQQLDNAPDAVALIEAKMREVLDIPQVVSVEEVIAVSKLPIPGKETVAFVQVEPEPEPKDITTQIVEVSKPEPPEIPIFTIEQESEKPEPKRKEVARLSKKAIKRKKRNAKRN